MDTAADAQLASDSPTMNDGLPNRLMTAFEVADFIGCHEETVRRAYLRGLLVSQRFGVRGSTSARRCTIGSSARSTRAAARVRCCAS